LRKPHNNFKRNLKVVRVRSKCIFWRFWFPAIYVYWFIFCSLMMGQLHQFSWNYYYYYYYSKIDIKNPNNHFFIWSKKICLKREVEIWLTLTSAFFQGELKLVVKSNWTRLKLGDLSDDSYPNLCWCNQVRDHPLVNVDMFHIPSFVGTIK
jgi:hypothetical protein